MHVKIMGHGNIHSKIQDIFNTDLKCEKKKQTNKNKKTYSLKCECKFILLSAKYLPTNAAVNGHLELPLLKDHQRFDAVSTSNLEVAVYKFREW